MATLQKELPISIYDYYDLSWPPFQEIVNNRIVKLVEALASFPKKSALKNHQASKSHDVHHQCPVGYVLIAWKNATWSKHTVDVPETRKSTVKVSSEAVLTQLFKLFTLYRPENLRINPGHKFIVYCKVSFPRKQFQGSMFVFRGVESSSISVLHMLIYIIWIHVWYI